jgi:hypothetical protein
MAGLKKLHKLGDTEPGIGNQRPQKYSYIQGIGVATDESHALIATNRTPESRHRSANPGSVRSSGLTNVGPPLGSNRDIRPLGSFDAFGSAENEWRLRKEHQPAYSDVY